MAPLPPLPLGRLPGSVEPLAYRLDLTVDPAEPRFSGRVEIDTRLTASSNVVFLHGRSLMVRRAVAMAGGQAFPGEWQQADPTGVAVLRFAAPLPAGPVTFAFEYDATFNDHPSGLFRVKVGDDWYSWSQFESIDARSAFPSFDEPGFKTPFTVTLRTRPGQMAISNAPELSAKVEQGQTVHRFQPTVPLPTYLVAMMVGPYVFAETQVPPTPHRAAPMPLRVITTRQNTGKMDFALEGSKQIVTLLEDYFGEAFPFPKLDQITTPILPGAMENAGADLYNDSILIMDDKASVSRKREFGEIVSHELAHQWFGDYVTPSWWEHIWLNESFANWLGYHIADEWRPDLKIGAGANVEGFAAMDNDALLAGRPIRQTIVTNAQVDASFDSITYGKGGQVLAMVASFIGKDKFREGVRRHIARHRYGSATSDDFFMSLAEAADDPRIVTALRSFTDQQGVPLLTFTRRGGQFTVTQSRYVPLGVPSPAAHWTVPMCVRRGQARQCVLFDDQSAMFELKGSEPLVPNVDGAGYYRFELPGRDWDALIAMADRLPAGEALAVADSLVASFRAGRARVSQIAALARKLVRNPDSHAGDAASAALRRLTAAELVDASAAPAFRAFIGRLYRPLLGKQRFDPRAGAYAGESSDVSQRRVQVVSHLVSWSRDHALRRAIADATTAFFAGDASALDPAWYDLAFGIFLEGDGLPAAKALMEKALASQDPEFRPAALDAVAGSGNAATANWLLNEFRDDRLRPSEQRGLLRVVIGTRTTRDIGYRWLVDHLDELTGGNEGIFYGARLPQMLGGFCSIDRAKEFARDLRPRFAGKPGELELARAIERVRNCGVLHDTLVAQVSAEINDLR